MREILQFIFSGFWVFIGTVWLISITGMAIARIILAIRGHES